ncbi:hypothetical protein P4E94_19200 [Pontiellaceae bacterium B12219]|nr:hypothetical protein [Pontiellaceae bacterium B12219]
MNKLQPYLPMLTLTSSIIIFLLGWKLTNNGDLSGAIPMFALSIILYSGAASLKTSLQIQELKKLISQQNDKNETDKKV